MKYSFIFLLFTIYLLPCTAQKVKPALKLTKDNTYYTVTSVNSTVSQTISGQQMNITIGMSAKTAFKVMAIRDTVYDMEVMYKSIGMKMQSAAGAMGFNSDDKTATDLPSRILTGMVDKPFYLTISTTGKVLEVRGIGKIMSSVFEGLPKMDSLQRQQVMAQFLQSFGEKSFKSNLEESMAIYPSVKVAKNDTWVINTQMQSVMEANVQSTYQLQEVTDTYYGIHGDSKIATVAGKDGQVNGMPVSYNLTGTIVNDIKADRITGWVLEARLKQHISGTFQIKDNPKVPDGMTVPMTVDAVAVTTNN